MRRKGSHRPLALASLALAAATGIASFAPTPHAAKVKIVPPQSGGGGLGALLGSGGGLSSLASLLGSRQPTEVFLTVARSHEVAREVVRRTGLIPSRATADDETRALRELTRTSEINVLKGGIIEFEATGTDTDKLLKMASAFADVFSERIKSMSLDEAARKQELIQDQLQRASTRLANAQEAMRVFRVNNRMVAPEAIVSSAISLTTTLRARLLAKEVERDTLGKMVTPQNVQYQNVNNEIAELHRRITAQEASTPKDAPLNYGKLSTDTTEYITLLREQRYAEALYEVFSRYHETLLLEQAAAGLNAQVVEAPHLDPSRRVRWPLAVACAAFLSLTIWAGLGCPRTAQRRAPNLAN
jgi:uncharacterized protein involved in exopolysaccharide biosynthesis